MSRIKRSSTGKPVPRTASRTAPIAPAPTAPGPAAPPSAPVRDRPLPHAPPEPPTRIRITGTNPWSVTVMSSLFLGGLGVCVLGAMLGTSVILDIVAPGAWPTPSDTLFIATGVVTLEVVLGTVMACLCSFMYNYTARFSGGVEVAVTDDLDDATPAAQALRVMTRLRARMRSADVTVRRPDGE
ncbi:DUF3566 domain-containing protein [Streptomyces arenae]|uniref:DUF3566 domain-containing protein n=1 Tax=Streptomyces arenae TaxID=29301 RepID=UPI0026599EBC|nr:DUF3566 domain-containing protein [Streptomyces arenae]MCG7203643.1 DUF3566 domain-containing protein [Streptomyces arenae]